MPLTLADGSSLPLMGFGTSTVKKNELTKALDTALEVGYRHINSCLFQNEQTIGKVLQKWFKSGKLKREEVFVTTKLPPGALYTDKVEIFMKKSLSNLQLTYVDLYLIHFPVPFQLKESSTGLPMRDGTGGVILDCRADHAAVWRKMEDQVQAGRARYIGVSNYNLTQIQIVLHSAKIKPACLEIEVHVLLQQHPLVDFCQKHNILVIAFSPLGSPDYNKTIKSMGSNERKELPNLLVNPTVQQISNKYKKTPAQVLLRFLVQSGVVPMPTSMNDARIKENLNIFDFELDRSDMRVLGSLDAGEAGRICDFRDVWKGVENHPHYPFEKFESME